MSDVQGLVQQLRLLAVHNPTRAFSALQETKTALLSLRSMPPEPHFDSAELQLISKVYIGETFELGALVCLRLNKEEEFEGHVAMLKTIYLDYASIPESPEQWRILSLYLTHLLAANKITEFHTELEQIPVSVRSNQYLSFAIALEQYFMEGNYNKVREIKQHAPDSDFVACITKLVSAISQEVARNVEQAYLSLSLSSAQDLLMLGSTQELLEFVRRQEGREVRWELRGDRVYFVRQENQKTQELPKWQIMEEALTIATELERIV